MSQQNLLKTKRFLPLFITQFMGAFNDNAFKNSFLIWFTYEIAEKQNMNAGMMVTIAAGLFILPFFLFSATAGQVADKYEKSWITQQVKILEIVLMLLCGVGFYFESVNGLLVLLFLMGVHSTFFGPIKYSLLPEHLKDDELIRGNGLIEAGTFLSILLGTIFGGLIIRTEYGIELLSGFVVLFSVIGWLASRKIPKSIVRDADLKIGLNVFKETLKIVNFAKQERTVWLSIIAISWFWLIGATFLTQFPVYTKDVLHGNEHIVTLLLTIFSVGIGIGSALCNKLLKGEINGRLVPVGLFGITISIMIFVVASYLYQGSYQDNIEIGFFEFIAQGIYSWLILASLLGLSVFSGIYIVPLYAIMQHRSDANFLSRIVAANNVLNALFMVMASVVVGLLFSLRLGVVEVLLAVGIFNIPVYFIIRDVVNKRLKNKN